MAKGTGRIAKRYARALFDLVRDAVGPAGDSVADLEQTRRSLESLAFQWRESEELRTTMSSPAIPIAARESAIRDVAEKLSPGSALFGNVVAVLLSNKRLPEVQPISKAFGELVDELKRLLALEVTSAFEISESEKKELEASISNQLGSFASGSSITWSVDKQLLGGLTIKVGDRLLDSSIRGSLEKVRAELM